MLPLALGGCTRCACPDTVTPDYGCRYDVCVTTSLKIHEVATGNTVASVKTGTDKVIDIAWNASTGYITTVGVKHVCFWRFTGRGFERCKKVGHCRCACVPTAACC